MPTNLILRIVSTQFLLVALLFLVTVAEANPPEKSNHLKDLNCTADQIAKFDGEQWVCASDAISDAKELVDANDQVLGSVLGIARPDALLVQLTLDGYSFRALAYSSRIETEGLTRISADIGGAMVYIDDQCLGQPYAGYDFPIFILETEPYAILTYYDLVDLENKSALVEVAASSAFPSSTYIRQNASPTGCVPTFRTFPNVVTFDILIDDVRTVYPPPYKIAE